MVEANEEDNRRCPACTSADSKIAGNKSGFDILICKSCNTIYTSRVPEQNEGEDYDEYYTADNLSVPDFIRRRAEEIVHGFAPYRKTNRLLDVGFGSGTILQAALDLGWETSGQEVSKPAVEQASKLGFEVFHGELEHAKYPDEHFDVVTASEIIEHLPDPRKTLREIARILRPGGLFWATTPNANSASFIFLGLEWTILSPPEHTQLYSKKGIVKLLAESGFSKVRLATSGLNPIEILHFYHSKFVRNKPGATFNRVNTGYNLNEGLTRTPLRRAIKSSLNMLLNTAGVGDSLKIFAER